MAHFITISEIRGYKIELQFEENDNFEKYLNSKISASYIKRKGTEKDEKNDRIIKYVQLPQRYWGWIKQDLYKYFSNVWIIREGKTYNLNGEEVTKKTVIKLE